MALTQAIIQSVVSVATMDHVVASIYGKTRANGGFNVPELRQILLAVNPKLPSSVRMRADIIAELIPFVPPDLMKKQVQTVPVHIKPTPVWTRDIEYVPLKNTYRPRDEDLSFYAATMYDVVYRERSSETWGMSGTALVSPQKVMKHVALMRQELLDSLHWNSTIFVRASIENMAHYQFMIAGPRDTPYDNGLFHFQMELPSNYPQSPPKVTILSTGRGQYRANPNLYASGKVCLSLLGTWAGPGWNAGRSNISEVILAIQAQILNEHPLRNEPGLETASDNNVDLYNAILRIYTIKIAMIDVLRDPPLGFEDAVLAFFTGPKRQEIGEQVVTWIKASRILPSISYSNLSYCMSYSFITNGGDPINEIRTLTERYGLELLNMLGLENLLE